MSSVFKTYSDYYDLLYQDKDYAGESNYVRKMIERFCPGSKSLLELGCGTGKHAALLGELGFEVTGIEQSTQMIEAADVNSSSVTVLQGDARSVRLGSFFDAVISLFHVVSYQTTNEDVRSFFETAALHLRRGGCFLFDVWYGPAVLRQLPQQRQKQIENDSLIITRDANPNVDFQRNLVDVNYDVEVANKSSAATERFQECHSMRYFFLPEIEFFAEAVGMNLIHSEQWLTSAAPSQETWGVTCVLQKPGS